MLRYFPAERRRRLAPLLLIVGVLTVGKLAYEEIPRRQPLRFALPARDIRALKVVYSSEQESFGGLERRFPEGAPREIEHAPSLSPGAYELAIELTERDGAVTQLRRSVRLPSEGTLRISLTAGDD